ncbi:hypothetical protein FJ250_12605, partial [bacterium]|nr:hypothetical protein [bacterium]
MAGDVDDRRGWGRGLRRIREGIAVAGVTPARVESNALVNACRRPDHARSDRRPAAAVPGLGGRPVRAEDRRGPDRAAVQTAGGPAGRPAGAAGRRAAGAGGSGPAGGAAADRPGPAGGRAAGAADRRGGGRPARPVAVILALATAFLALAAAFLAALPARGSPLPPSSAPLKEPPAGTPAPAGDLDARLLPWDTLRRLCLLAGLHPPADP